MFQEDSLNNELTAEINNVQLSDSLDTSVPNHGQEVLESVVNIQSLMSACLLDDNQAIIEKVNFHDFETALTALVKQSRKGWDDRQFSRVQYHGGRIIIKEASLPQRELISPHISKHIDRCLNKNDAEEQFINQGSTRVHSKLGQKSLEARCNFILDCLYRSPDIRDDNGVPQGVIVAEVHLSEDWGLMHELSISHMTQPFCAVMINIVAIRNKNVVGRIAGGKIDQLYYVEYRKGPDNTPYIHKVKSFGAHTSVDQWCMMCESTGHQEAPPQDIDLCIAPDVDEFVMRVPGDVLWSTVPVNLRPVNFEVLSSRDIVLDLFRIRELLKRGNYAL